jgi:hypothetical protein
MAGLLSGDDLCGLRSTQTIACDFTTTDIRAVRNAKLPRGGRNGSGCRCRSHLGLKPGQLPAATGVIKTGTTLVADDAERKADQDRVQGDASLEVRDVPTRGSGGHAELVRGDPRPHRAVGDAAAGRRPDACVGVSCWPGKAGPIAKTRALRAPHARKLACRSMIPATRTKKPGRPFPNMR